MGYLRRLWHRLLFGSFPVPAPAAPPRRAAPAARPPAAPPRPAVRPPAVRPASPFTAAEVAALQWLKARPPRCVYRSRQEGELAFLLAWVPDDERRRFLDALLPRAGRQDPWSLEDVDEDLWQQCQRWREPVVIQESETMSREDLSTLLETQLRSGLYTYCTSLDLLSRPVRMLWLLRQGRQVGQVYAALEQALGRAQALDAAWWVVAGL